MTATYLELINRGPRFYPDRIAVVFNDERLTFQQVGILTNRIANRLINLGLKKGSRIALLLNNGLYSIPIDFSCVKAGLNRVPLNSRLSTNEHQKMLEETSCEILLYGPDLAERADELQKRVPGLLCHGIGSDAAGGIDILSNIDTVCDEPPAIQVTPDDDVLTLFTSGTTGTLKAAVHTQASFAAMCRNILLNLIDVQFDDAMLHAGSLVHAAGCFVLPFWVRGARSVVMPGFDSEEYLKMIPKERVTVINLVPTMLQMLLGHPEIASTDVSSLRRVIYGASPIPKPVLKEAMALWGSERFWQFYGQSECPMCFTVLRPDDHAREELLSACGRPSADIEMRLIDEDGNDVPTGIPGEIVVRGPSMMKGYHNAPQLNDEMFLEDGWLRTRDVGLFDENGVLHLKDRTSDMIISGGYNVYPSEIEDILVAHQSVAECAVIGIKDPKWVEAVAGVVVRKSGSNVSEKELIDFVSNRLASYKKPQQVIFVEEIPKTAVGKLNRKALRDTFNNPSNPGKNQTFVS